jgi:hypothetical protein
VPDPVDGLRHRLVDGVALEVLHEAAIDLEVVDGEVLQVAEGARARAEIVEREQEPHRLALRMNSEAWRRLLMAAVSVISKQMDSGGTACSSEASRMKARKPSV